MPKRASNLSRQSRSVELTEYNVQTQSRRVKEEDSGWRFKSWREQRFPLYHCHKGVIPVINFHILISIRVYEY